METLPSTRSVAKTTTEKRDSDIAVHTVRDVRDWNGQRGAASNIDRHVTVVGPFRHVAVLDNGNHRVVLFGEVHDFSGFPASDTRWDTTTSAVLKLATVSQQPVHFLYESFKPDPPTAETSGLSLQGGGKRRQKPKRKPSMTQEEEKSEMEFPSLHMQFLLWNALALHNGLAPSMWRGGTPGCGVAWAGGSGWERAVGGPPTPTLAGGKQ